MGLGHRRGEPAAVADLPALAAAIGPALAANPGNLPVLDPHVGPGVAQPDPAEQVAAHFRSPRTCAYTSICGGWSTPSNPTIAVPGSPFWITRTRPASL